VKSIASGAHEAKEPEALIKADDQSTCKRNDVLPLVPDDEATVEVILTYYQNEMQTSNLTVDEVMKRRLLNILASRRVDGTKRIHRDNIRLSPTVVNADEIARNGNFTHYFRINDKETLESLGLQYQMKVKNTPTEDMDNSGLFGTGGDDSDETQGGGCQCIDAFCLCFDFKIYLLMKCINTSMYCTTAFIISDLRRS